MFTFTRTTVTSGNYKGRAEMSFCFTKPTSPMISTFNSFQLAYLSHTKRIMNYCDNAVHTTSKSTRGEYTAWINIPNDTGTTKAKSIILQWHGRPNRLVYKNISSDSIHELHDSLMSIKDAASLQTAINAYNILENDKNVDFNQGGHPPLSVKIYQNYFVVVARYDNRKYHDRSIDCHPDISNLTVGQTVKCLDTPTDKIYFTLIYRELLTSWIDTYTMLKLVVDWRPLGTNSSVKVYKHGTLVIAWQGLLGRNDRNGPYMKYGIYSSSKNKNFRLQIMQAESKIYN